VAADQGADGAWHIGPRDTLGSPATYGTSLATYMALRTLKAAGGSEFRGAIEKAEAWLREAPPHSVLDAAALSLALRDASDPPAALKRRDCLRLILATQTTDGGWGPYADSPPEPFDTAIVLLALAGSREEPEVRERIGRGRRFLVATQNADGSWPETTRPPKGESYAQRMSTTGWALLALLATGREIRDP
jgi:hypothetical protein